MEDEFGIWSGTYILLEEARSKTSKDSKPYARKGDEVEVVEDFGGFCIVERKGVRFSVSKSLLAAPKSKDEVEEKPAEPVVISPPSVKDHSFIPWVPQKKKTKSKGKDKPSAPELF